MKIIEHNNIPENYWMICLCLLVGLISGIFGAAWRIVRLVAILITFPLSVPTIAWFLVQFKKLQKGQS